MGLKRFVDFWFLNKLHVTFLVFILNPRYFLTSRLLAHLYNGTLYLRSGEVNNCLISPPRSYIKIWKKLVSKFLQVRENRKCRCAKYILNCRVYPHVHNIYCILYTYTYKYIKL